MSYPEPVHADDNTHEVDPATGKPWPIEQGCCSYHYPARPTDAEWDALPAEVRDTLDPGSA